MTQASIVLVDGEHYPDVIRRAIDQMRLEGESPELALMVGGGEKLGQVDFEIGIPVEDASADPEASLAAALHQHKITRVIDLSDEPVLGYVQRSRLASVALWRGAIYKGADFEFTPPPRPRLSHLPSVGVIGTGKRTGKTSIGGAVARAYQKAGFSPVIVAMGRGGPPHPVVIASGNKLGPQDLLKMVEGGEHAASDYIEDAITSGVTTVGAWRAGGGLAGATSYTNYEEAVQEADRSGAGILVAEGSGSAIPPIHTDAAVLIVDAGIDPGALCGYFGFYRVLLADLIVLTMCEESTDREHLKAVERCIRSGSLNQPKVIHTVFRPHPLSKISGKKVWFATTAGQQAGNVLKTHLEQHFDAEVIGMSHSLSDRKALRSELENSAEADVLLVEVKAAAVDVVTRFGLENGKEVVYVDNRPQVVWGSEDLEAELISVGQSAKARFQGSQDD